MAGKYTPSHHLYSFFDAISSPTHHPGWYPFSIINWTLTPVQQFPRPRVQIVHLTSLRAQARLVLSASTQDRLESGPAVETFFALVVIAQTTLCQTREL